MLLDDDVADLGLKSGGTSTEVEDHLTLIKLNIILTILGNDVNELEYVLAILKRKLAIVAKRVGVIGHVGILIDLDGGTSQLHIGGDGDAHVIALAFLNMEGHTSD